MTFYDFDVGQSQVQGAQPAIELMQMGPQAVGDVQLPNPTELAQYSSWAQVPSLTAAARTIVSTMPASSQTWGTITHCVTTHAA